MEKIKNWNGDLIECCRSRGAGQVISFLDYTDNLIPWSNADRCLAEIASRKGRKSDYAKEAYEILIQKRGFLSRLQSIRSEDALTWTVFGGLLFKADEDQTLNFATAFLMASGYRLQRPLKRAKVELWKRIAHPETGQKSRGPEIDFVIDADHIIVLGEAKWQAPLGERQGIKKDQDQLQIRKKYIDGQGREEHPNSDIIQILVTEQPYAGYKEKLERLKTYNLVWEDLCALLTLPQKDEIIRYLRWKKAYSGF